MNRFLRYFIVLIISLPSSVVHAWDGNGWNSGALYLRHDDATISFDYDNDAWSSTKPLRYPGDTMSATVLVASSTSLNKNAADYICDGDNDHVEINAAIQDIADSNAGYGTVKLSEGRFDIEAPILIHAEKIRLEGTGAKGSTLYVKPGANCNAIEINISDGSPQIFYDICNLRIDGNDSGNTAGWGIYVDNDSNIKDVNIRDVSVANCYDGGVYIGSPWGCVIDNLVSEFCTGPGLYILADAGLECKVINLKSMANDAGQLRIVHSTNPNINSACKFVNCRFVANQNDETVIDIGASSNVFMNCDVSAENRTGVTLINCTGSRNSFQNIILSSNRSDTYAFKFPSNANSNYLQAVTSFAVSDPNRVLYLNAGIHNRISMARRGAGFTWVDEGVRFDAPLIGDGTDKTINMLFDEGSASKPGIRFNHSTNTMQYSHDGTTWTDLGS